MLDAGFYTSVSEIGETDNISKSYMSRILRLVLLAPDIVEAILAGRTDQGTMLEQLERPLPACWEEQREGLGIGRRCQADDHPRLLPPCACLRAPAEVRPRSAAEAQTRREGAGDRRRNQRRRTMVEWSNLWFYRAPH